MCPMCPSLFPSVFLPCRWTWILVLLTVMFCLSSGKVCRPVNTFPTHSLSGVCLARTHQYASTSRCLSVVSPPLFPGRPSGGSLIFFFLFSSNVLLAFVVSKCCQLSRPSPGPRPSIPRVHPSMSLLLFLSPFLFFDLLCHSHSSFPPALTSPIISWLPLYLAFFSPAVYCAVH